MAEIIKKRSAHLWRTVGTEDKKNRHRSGFVERKSHKMWNCGLQIRSVYYNNHMDDKRPQHMKTGGPAEAS